jgi:F-type H+-transporting ATPase subunit gamma
MAQTAQIRSVIQSTKKTEKITRAMQLVAASKLQKTQNLMAKSRPYADKMLEVISHVAGANSECRHPYLEDRTKTHHAYIVVSTDRGLCGGLNTNLFKTALVSMKNDEAQEIKTSVALFGNKGAQFFKRLNTNIIAERTHMGDQPAIAEIIGVVKVALDAYMAGALSHVTLVYNRFVNTMKQTPVLLPLLPLTNLEASKKDHVWDYLYEPDAVEVLALLLDRYIEAEVYQGVIENIACEQAARMVAMKSATENAEQVIAELQLVYNKARQAAITQELAEIVSGAEAV